LEVYKDGRNNPLYEAEGGIQRPDVMRQGNNGAGPVSAAEWMGEMMEH
jgi:hypothetical protein